MRRSLGSRDFAAGAAVAFAVVAFGLLFAGALPMDSWMISPWLSVSLIVFAISAALNFLDRRRLAGLAALLVIVSGATVIAGYLLAFNGLLTAPARWGAFLLDLTSLHLSVGVALVALGSGTLAAATYRRHSFVIEILAASTLVVLLIGSIFIADRYHLLPTEIGVLVQPLALPDIVLLIAATVLLVLLALLQPAREFDLRHRFLPALAFALLLSVSLHLWLALIALDHAEVRFQTTATAERLRTSLVEHVKERIDAVSRLAARMSAVESIDREQWVRDARNYLEDFESLSTIGWVSSDHIIQQLVTKVDVNYQVGDRYGLDGMRGDMLERARIRGRIAFSDPLPLGNEGFGQVMAAPVVNERGFQGWLLAGMRNDILFSRQVEQVAPEFAIQIQINDETVFQRGGLGERRPFSVPLVERVEIGDLRWRVRIWPEDSYFEHHFQWLPGLLLMLGIVAAALFAFSLFQLEAQRRRTANLRRSEERFRLVAEQTGEVVYDYHIGSGRIQWAGAIKDVLLVDPEDFADVDIEQWESLLHPDDRETVIRELERAETHLERFQSEYRFRRGDGTYIRVDDRGVFLPGRAGKAERLLGAMSDVTERYEFENQLRYLAHFDQQTGLRNRVWFMEDAVLETEAALEQNESVWLVFMDVDRFKAINATLGHTVGDLLLEVVARRLEAFVDDRGALARLGGDEFALSIHRQHFDHEAMLAFCDALMQEFASPLYVGGHSLFVTLSAGIACFPRDGKNAQEVIRAAETAMFRAKQRGKNTYAFYEASMSTGARENLDLANALRAALENDEFHLEFQPRYGLNSGRITGMEALLRWENEARGMVPPALFIPIAEETGLIGPIGWYVVDAAAVAARQLGPDLMLGRRVAINVSARQLADANFVPELIRRVHAAGAMPYWFEIELTESLIMEDPQYTSELLGLMHEAGFTISIDDFGTGYSSLSYLKNFAVDNLKIDRSFVMGLPESQDDAAIVRTIIGMGNELGLRLIAEGIETEEQSRFLREAGCQEAQGYLFARPMRLEKLIPLLN